MHDAGYDVRQAPIAWQILTYWHAKRPLALRPPPESVYLSNLINLDYSPTMRAALHRLTLVSTASNSLDRNP
jgi:hypothetical protein